MLEVFRWSSILLAALAVGWPAMWLSTVASLARPKYGHRGILRLRAIETPGLFATFEPAIRYLAALVARLARLERLRERLTRELSRADDVLGLSADEFIALSLTTAGLLGGCVGAIAHVAHGSAWYGAGAVLLGSFLPTLQVEEVIRRRAKLVSRALPPAIEIAAMCMGAGMDFPGSLRMLAERDDPIGNPLGREFAVILEHLDFGQTRRVALEHFAERVPSRPVADFVHAVIQAEQKGNPLARVLQVQGRMLNMRRSVAAEEAAARAGVLMIIPMVFLVGAILLLLMGPFMVKGIGW